MSELGSEEVEEDSEGHDGDQQTPSVTILSYVRSPVGALMSLSEGEKQGLTKRNDKLCWSV